MGDRSSSRYIVKRIEQFFDDDKELYRKVTPISSSLNDLDIVKTFILAFHQAREKAIQKKNGEIFTSHFDEKDSYSHIVYRLPSVKDTIQETMIFTKTR